MHSLHKVSSREVGGLGHSIRRGAGVNKVHSGFLIRYRTDTADCATKKIHPMEDNTGCLTTMKLVILITS